MSSAPSPPARIETPPTQLFPPLARNLRQAAATRQSGRPTSLWSPASHNCLPVSRRACLPIHNSWGVGEPRQRAAMLAPRGELCESGGERRAGARHLKWWWQSKATLPSPKNSWPTADLLSQIRRMEEAECEEYKRGGGEDLCGGSHGVHLSVCRDAQVKSVAGTFTPHLSSKFFMMWSRSCEFRPPTGGF